MMRTTMKISQADWDHLWEASTGVQKKMFDEDGYPPEPSIRTATAALALLRIPMAYPSMYPCIPPWEGIN